jgi:hypothetical protein
MKEREIAAMAVYQAAVDEYERTGEISRFYQAPLEDLCGVPWTVIGITKEALQRFHDIGYKYQPGSGIQRCHLTHRVDTFRNAVREEFKTYKELIKYLAKHSETVLGYLQNGPTPPTDWIKLNPKLGLFQSTNCGYAWRVKHECVFLQKLYKKEMK